MDADQVTLPPVGATIPAVGTSIPATPTVAKADLPPVGATAPSDAIGTPTPWQSAIINSITRPIVMGSEGLARLRDTANSIADQALGPLAKTYDPNKAMAQGQALLAHPASSVLNTFVPVDSTIEDIKKGNYGGAAANVGMTLAGAAGLHEALTHPIAPLEGAVEARPAAEAPKTTPEVPVATPPAAAAEIPPVGATIAAEAPPEPSVRSAPVASELPAVGTTVAADHLTVPPAGAIPEANLAPPDVFLKQFPEDVRPTMQTILEENGGFEEQRRGVQSNERTAALARGMTPETVEPGTAVNAETRHALVNAAYTAVTDLDALSKKVADGTATPEDRLALKQKATEATALVQSARGTLTEAARTLQAAQMIPELLQSNTTASVLYKMLGDPAAGEIDNFAEKWATAPDDDARVKLLQSQKPMSKFDMLVSAFYSSLLSAPKTIARAFTGTAANAAFRKASLFPAAAIDAVQSAITGEPRTIHPITELTAQAGAVPEAATAAAQTAADVLRTGHVNSTELLNKIAEGQAHIPRPELPGGGANPINWPTRAFSAKFEGMQKFYGMPELAGRLASEAHTQADAAGVTGTARDTFINEKMDELTHNPPPEIVKAASDEARSILFREDNGPFLNAIQNFGQRGGPLGKIVKTLVVPFAQIGGKIIKQGVENSPLAPLSGQFQDAIAAGGRVRAEALGRLATGTGLMGTAAALAAAGYITGSEPTDPTQRANWRLTGKQPYSVKIGNTYYGFDQLAQPVALGLRTIADAVDQYKTTGAIDPVQVMASLGPNIVNNSFLSGLSSAIDAVANKDRSGLRFVQGLAQDAVPFSSLLRSVTQTVDPTVRAPATVGQAIESILPGVSKNVPARLDPFGQPVVRTGNAVARGLSPSLVSKVNADPMVLALAKHGITDIGVPVNKLQKSGHFPAIDLTEHDRQLLGHATRQAVELVVQNPGWENLDDDAAKTLIHRVITTAHDNAIKQIRLEHQHVR